ncbi:uncharacterized protein VTP21DRAFT_10221 [Calcarisporiella thermophila]|uniref:uncharacterized protein n=1 Tax=Calcarisporiella thermophila TaxID=911321 RepID=UPI0037435597
MSTKLPSLMPEGLHLYYDFVTDAEEMQLITAIDSQEWAGNGSGPNPELLRRTQQYGYLFSYRYRKILEEIGPLPDFFSFLLARIKERRIISEENMPNSLIVNEYLVGQGIMPHIDAPSIFGEFILALSLLTPCVMRFQSVEDEECIDILLPPRSLLVMSGKARYKYKHSISKNAIDYIDEQAIERGRRVSLTMRRIL